MVYKERDNRLCYQKGWEFGGPEGRRVTAWVGKGRKEGRLSRMVQGKEKTGGEGGGLRKTAA